MTRRWLSLALARNKNTLSLSRQQQASRSHSKSESQWKGTLDRIGVESSVVESDDTMKFIFDENGYETVLARKEDLKCFPKLIQSLRGRNCGASTGIVKVRTPYMYNIT